MPLIWSISPCCLPHVEISSSSHCMCSPAIPVNSRARSAWRRLEVSDGWMGGRFNLHCCSAPAAQRQSLTWHEIRIHESTAAYPPSKSINHNIFFIPISKAAKDKVNGLQDWGYLGGVGKGACLSYRVELNVAEAHKKNVGTELRCFTKVVKCRSRRRINILQPTEAWWR